MYSATAGLLINGLLLCGMLILAILGKLSETKCFIGFIISLIFLAFPIYKLCWTLGPHDRERVVKNVLISFFSYNIVLIICTSKLFLIYLKLSLINSVLFAVISVCILSFCFVRLIFRDKNNSSNY